MGRSANILYIRRRGDSPELPGWSPSVKAGGSARSERWRKKGQERSRVQAELNPLVLALKRKGLTSQGWAKGTGTPVFYPINSANHLSEPGRGFPQSLQIRVQAG